MSTSYRLGDRPTARPFPVWTWLGVVSLLAVVAGTVLWRVTHTTETEISNPPAVTRTVKLAPAAAR